MSDISATTDAQSLPLIVPLLQNSTFRYRSILTRSPFTLMLQPLVFPLLLLVMLLAAPAQAAEVAAFIGQRYGWHFKDFNTVTIFDLVDFSSFGLLLDFDREPDQQIEIMLSRQNTNLKTLGTFTGVPQFDLTIDYYHLGGLYMLPKIGQVYPFVDRKSVV